MSGKCILAFDIGTTMIKMVLFDKKGTLRYDDSFKLNNYNLDGHQVQRAEDWWNGIRELTHKLVDSDFDTHCISAIVSTGQMEDCLLLNDEGHILTEVLLYSDGRATEEHILIKKKIGEDILDEILGNRFDPLMSVNKYIWLRNNRRKVFDQHSYLILGAKDYLNFKLTGSFVTDYTNASTTGFMDIKQGKWSSIILKELVIDITKLPPIEKATTIIGQLKKDIADELKLPPEIPVVNGSGDVGASTIGAGAWKEGDVFCYLGTTGWLAAPIDKISDNTNVFTLSNIEGEGFILAGAVLNAGKPYDWYLSEFISDFKDKALSAEDYRQSEEIISDLNAAEKKLFFLPFLNGERSPIKIKENSGAFLGIGLETNRYLLLRAVLEGVAFSLKHNLSELSGLNKDIQQLNLIGGGSKSRIWPQILSNILDLEVITLNNETGAPSLGAVLMAYKALSWINDYGDFEKEFCIKERFKPETDITKKYKDAFKEYLIYLNKLFRK